MKIVFVIIVALLIALQFQLWFGKDGITHTIRLRHAVTKQVKENQKIYKQNKRF